MGSGVTLAVPSAVEAGSEPARAADRWDWSPVEDSGLAGGVAGRVWRRPSPSAAVGVVLA